MGKHHVAAPSHLGLRYEKMGSVAIMLREDKEPCCGRSHADNHLHPLFSSPSQLRSDTLTKSGTDEYQTSTDGFRLVPTRYQPNIVEV